MTIIVGFRVVFVFINRLLSMMYAFLPEPLGSTFIVLIAISVALLLIQLAMVLKQLIFNWL